MKNKEIEKLLEKYFEGDTSLQEEKRLQHYFLYEEVDMEWKEYRIWFAALKQESEIIDESNEKYAFLENTGHRIPLVRNKYWAIAATLLVLLGSWFFFQQQKTAVSSPSQQELLLAQKYLNQAFRALHKGYQQTDRLAKTTDKIQRQTQEALKVGAIYQKNTKEITPVYYLDKSFNKLSKLSKMKKSKIKLIM